LEETQNLLRKTDEEVIEMRHNTEGFGVRPIELVFFALGVIVLLILAPVARGQTGPSPTQQLPYREYRGVRLGMTAEEARAKLGVPVMMSDEQDYYLLSANETTQIVYANQKVVTISTDYTNGVGAPDYKSVVGEKLLQRPDGSLFRMVLYDSEHFWVSYNKTASVVPMVTITIGTLR
jgi:hypothetical protein